MANLEIELDHEASLIMDALVAAHDGDASVVVSELLHTHEAMEAMMDEWELENVAELAKQKQQSESDFREGRVLTWDEVKRRNGLC